jgi:transcriptional regulator with XRE-family HTH domain
MNEREWLAYFGVNLEEYLKAAKMSQRDLADASGLSEAAVSNYIRGRKMPGVRALINMAEALNCSVDELVDFGLGKIN